jgi:hypothetical protein
MALDIRLDFIQHVDPMYIEKMKEIRKGFIAVDDLLKGMADEATTKKNLAASRTVALARTFNEQALQCVIKSFAILGEVHAMTPDELASHPA